MTYNAIHRLVNERGWKRVWDDETKTPWAVSPDGTAVIGYDDAESLAIKTEWALKKGLRGVFFWQIAGDRLPDGSFPLQEACARAPCGGAEESALIHNPPVTDESPGRRSPAGSPGEHRGFPSFCRPRRSNAWSLPSGRRTTPSSAPAPAPGIRPAARRQPPAQRHRAVLEAAPPPGHPQPAVRQPGGPQAVAPGEPLLLPDDAGAGAEPDRRLRHPPRKRTASPGV